MEKHQRNKLIVAILFITLITAASVWAYITILMPVREYRKATGKKYTQKKAYKTEYLRIQDSLLEAKKLKNQQK